MYRKKTDENNNEILEKFETKEVIENKITLHQLVVKKIQLEKKIEKIDIELGAIITDTDITQKIIKDLYDDCIEKNLYI